MDRLRSGWQEDINSLMRKHPGMEEEFRFGPDDVRESSSLNTALQLLHSCLNRSETFLQRADASLKVSKAFLQRADASLNRTDALLKAL